MAPSSRTSCSEFKSRIFHYQADELSEHERRGMDDHLAECPRCAGRLEVEDGLLRGLRARLRPESAPPELVERVRGALREQSAPASSTPMRRASAWLLPIAASIALAVALVPGTLTGTAGVAVDRVVTVVDLECDMAGKSYGDQRACRHPDHGNALRVASGDYWAIGMAEPSGRRIVFDEELRGHRLRVRGTLYPDAGTVHVAEADDLGLIADTARLGLLAP